MIAAIVFGLAYLALALRGARWAHVPAALLVAALRSMREALREFEVPR